MTDFRVGTSGFIFPDWREKFYPRDLPQREWLVYYAERFNTVEINSTAYRLANPSHIRRWISLVPPGFDFTVKMSMLLTHRRKTAGTQQWMTNFIDRVAHFGDRLSQILCQFPATLRRDDERLESFLESLPQGYRYVAEFRHDSWFCDATYALLRKCDVAFCIHDYPGCAVPRLVTSNVAYVRFHGTEGPYTGAYDRRHLEMRAAELRELGRSTAKVYCYFNNDIGANAPKDATTLASFLL